MKKYELDNRAGFDVIHNSGSWRIAVHAFEPEVNGLASFQKWGIHLDSEEGFVLLKGKAWLVLTTDDQESHWEICPLEKEQLYLVQQGERHAIVLKEDSEVLIIENRDMSQSCNMEISQEVQETVRKEIEATLG